jgi:polyisoprenoid-binding protein YceI
MKKLSIIVCTLVLTLAHRSIAQQVLTSKSTFIKFESKTPVRNIEAENTASTTLINLATNDVAVRIPIKSFNFPNKLMQEHFNENYMDSEKIPFASYKGKISEKIDINKDGKYPVTAVGKINIHGVERDQTLKGTATVANKTLVIDTAFEVSLAAHKIEIPKIVFVEIAENVKVSCKFTYVEKK